MKIQEIIEQLRTGNLDDPATLSNFLVKLAASQMTAKNFEAEAYIEMKKKWLELKAVLKANSKEKSDKQVDAEVTQTSEWREWRKMSDAVESIDEVVKALKKKLSTVVY